MDFLPGQFVELSIPGVGEAPFGFASSPLEKGYVDLTIKRTGVLTDAIHALLGGDALWIRGPFGTPFPLAEIQGHDVLFVAGGIGLAPLRPLIYYVAEKRADFGAVTMLLAARSSTDLIYREECATWHFADVTLTIDREEPDWTGSVGFPHTLVDALAFDRKKTVAVLCGPPIMIKAVAGKLQAAGMPPARILTTLEMRMTCGIGKCGKCNIGHQYVCVDGPVFSLEQLAAMPDEY
jgi:NAD(P)H-flavin reductase